MRSISQDRERVRHNTAHDLSCHENKAYDNDDPELSHCAISGFDLLLEFLIAFKNTNVMRMVIMEVMIALLLGCFFGDQLLALTIDVVLIMMWGMIHLLYND